MISKLISVLSVIIKRRDVQNHSANKSRKLNSHLTLFNWTAAREGTSVIPFGHEASPVIYRHPRLCRVMEGCVRESKFLLVAQQFINLEALNLGI